MLDITLRLRWMRLGLEMTISMSFAFEFATKLLQVEDRVSSMVLLQS